MDKYYWADDEFHGGGAGTATKFDFTPVVAELSF